LSICLDAATKATPQMIIGTTLWVAASAAMVFVIASALLKSWSKGAEFATLMMILTFCFPNTLVQVGLNCAQDTVFPLLAFGSYCILTAALFLFIYKSPTVFSQHTPQLNFVVSLLLISSLIPYINAEIKIRGKANQLLQEDRAIIDGVTLDANAARPDIYYIILDGAANPYTLRDYYNYDNFDFIKSLQKLGFFVTLHSHSNYDRTILSLPSSLNMRYIDFVPHAIGSTKYERFPYLLIQNNNVSELLRRLGYKIVNVASGMLATEHNSYADINLGTGWGTELELPLMHITPITFLEPRFAILGQLLKEKRLNSLRQLTKVASMPGPKFVMVHILCPHAPFCVDENGKAVPVDSGSTADYYDAIPYRKQLTFIEAQTERYVTELMSITQGKAIIVIQSDHGPASLKKKDKPTQDYLKERFRILNAYYLPGKTYAQSGLYDSITPVNSFRVVLNDYFAANLPLLPDRSFWAPSGAPYIWTEEMVEDHSSGIGATRLKQIQ
jgi:hypothetical protein